MIFKISKKDGSSYEQDFESLAAVNDYLLKSDLSEIVHLQELRRKESKMTQGKYKIGDEWLVRLKVISVNPLKLGNRFNLEIGVPSDEMIYSLAPEFLPKQEIEVSNDIDRAGWMKVLFIADIPSDTHRYKGVYSDNVFGQWKFARKIQKEPEIITVNGKKYKEIE